MATEARRDAIANVVDFMMIVDRRVDMFDLSSSSVVVC
jgi:hypothetical protein